jgi:hypothetical protein
MKNIEIFEDSTPPTRLKLDCCDNSGKIRLIAVDSNGTRLSNGTLATIDTDGELVIYRSFGKEFGIWWNSQEAKKPQK